jgi:outer membrane protein TolC
MRLASHYSQDFVMNTFLRFSRLATLASLCVLFTLPLRAEHTLSSDKLPFAERHRDTALSQLPVLELQDAVALSLQQNPGLAEMQARARAMAAIPSQMGSLPDPVVSLSTMNLPVDSFSTSQEAMTQLQFGLSQQLPFPGKLALREEEAEFEAAAALNNVDEMRLRLVRDVKQGWWTLFYLDRALQTINRSQELLRQLVDVAGAKYKVGKGLQQDVLLAQLELSRLLDRKIQLQAMRHSEVARLNVLLNKPVEQDLQVPDSSAMQLPTLLSDIELYKLANQHSPLLAVKQNQLSASRSRRDLAEKDLMPDFNLGAWYGFRNADDPRGNPLPDMLSMKLSMNVPLFAKDKQAKAVDQRNSELLGQQYALQDLRNNVYARISSARADYLRAAEQFSLYRTGIIPQARQTVSSMLAAYQVNKVDFLNLVRAQLTLYDYETRYWQAFTDAHRAFAQVIAAVGEEHINEQ